MACTTQLLLEPSLSAFDTLLAINALPTDKEQEGQVLLIQNAPNEDNNGFDHSHWISSKSTWFAGRMNLPTREMETTTSAYHCPQ